MTQHHPETSRPVIGYLVVLSVVSLINLYLVIDARCQLRAATDDQVNAVAKEVLRLLEPQTIHRRQAKRHSEGGPALPPKGSAPSRSSTDGVTFNVNGTRHSSAPEFYATVPMDVMTRFCKDSTTYCSSEYVRGEKGTLGPIGPPGLKGSKGEPGLDGIDGSPGQPGLDGILGAQGADGPKGEKGDKGDNGIPGTHGIDGINGINGISGEKGDKGDTGYPGLRGQRGLKGDQGERGEAGIPGIQTWMPKNSDLKSAADVLIPPQIVLSPESSSVEVTEGVSLSLMCSASGQPRPKVSWSRIDGKPIFGNPHVSSVEDNQLNISLVTRADMGVYVCTAANGIPPLATRTISLNVAFAPLIRIQKWNVASWNGGGVVLECLTEAYPPPVNFWISRSGNIIGEWNFGFEVNYVESSLKYVPNDETLSSYQHRMTLNITYVTPSDLGSYLCVSKNVRGQAVGTIDLSNQNEPLDWRSSSEEATFGTEAKEKQHMQCLRRCPECRCKSALPEMADVRNEYSDVDKQNWTRKPDRNPGCTLDSRLSRVGKPVMYLENDTSYSAWWQDEVYHPDSENATRVFYATRHGDNTHLYMFKTRELFQNGSPSKSIPLISPFHGNGNLLINGTFYYHQNASNNIVRVPLHSRSFERGEMSVLAVEDMAFSNRTFLFGQQQNYAMISADENGLWIIYSSTRSNNTMILKIDEKTFEKQFIWNLTLPHKKIGQMFIMCGVLYAVNSVTEPNAQIYSYAYDLIADTIISLEAPIAFTNPFANTTFLTYNPREHELFSTDNGNHLVYPIRTLEEDRRAELLEVQLRTA